MLLFFFLGGKKYQPRASRDRPKDLHLLHRVGACVYLLKRIRKPRNGVSAEKTRAVFIRLLNPKPGRCVASCMCWAYPDLADLCPARTLNAVKKKKFYIALKRVGAWPSRISCKLSAAACFQASPKSFLETFREH